MASFASDDVTGSFMERCASAVVTGPAVAGKLAVSSSVSVAASEFSRRFSPSFCCVGRTNLSWNQQQQSDAASHSEGGTIIEYGRVSEAIPKKPSNHPR